MFTKKKSWKENVRKNTENSTATFLTKLFTKIGVYKICNQILIWAEAHRKAMFTITVSFLIFVTAFSIFTRPQRSGLETLKAEKAKIENIGNGGIEKSRNSLSALFELAKIREEIKQVQEKGKLTASDTLKIKELYNKVKQIK